MRLIVPFASAVSAIRYQVTRTMSSNDHNMRDENIRSFLKDVYQKTNCRNVFSVFVSGGGSTALEWLFTVPGASNSLMDAGVVYSRPSLNAFIKVDKDLDSSPAPACSSTTALAMANASWRHANEFLLESSRDFTSFRDAQIFGLSCTASLVSEAPKKGAHRVYVASTMQAEARVYSVEFQKGQRTRASEDAACSRLILDAIAQCSKTIPLPADYLLASSIDVKSWDTTCPATETVKMTIVERPDVLDRVCKGQIRQALFIKRLVESNSPDILDLCINDHFVVLEDVPLPKGSLVFPGSFNPLHEGHIALVVAALQKLSKSPSPSSALANSGYSSGSESDSDVSQADGSHDDWKRIPVVFEIAAINADKPPLPSDEIVRRMMQFDPLLNPLLKAVGLTNIAVCVTSEPFFLQKSKLFSGCNFLIGSDTMSRIINSKYYGDNASASQPADGLSAAVIERMKEKQRLHSTFAMVTALTTIAERGCRFVVGGRVASSLPDTALDSQFDTFQSICEKSDVGIPQALLHSLFEGLSEEEFRLDLSSTQLRNRT